MAENEQNASQQPLPGSSPTGGGNGGNSSGSGNTAGGSSTSSTSSSSTTAGPPQNIQQLVASKRLQQAQAQVGEVVDIMRVNVEKVLERDSKLSELDRRADDLQEGASQFQQQAVKLKRKFWWENIKMWIIIGIVILFLIAVVVLSTSSSSNGTTTHVNVVETNATLETLDDTGSPFTTLKKIQLRSTSPAPPPPQNE